MLNYCQTLELALEMISFLLLLNDCWLFFVGVADGMVAPHEKVSPCIYPEYYLPFITISLIVLLYAAKQHKCH